MLTPIAGDENVAAEVSAVAKRMAGDVTPGPGEDGTLPTKAASKRAVTFKLPGVPESSASERGTPLPSEDPGVQDDDDDNNNDDNDDDDTGVPLAKKPQKPNHGSESDDDDKKKGKEDDRMAVDGEEAAEEKGAVDDVLAPLKQKSRSNKVLGPNTRVTRRAARIEELEADIEQDVAPPTVGRRKRKPHEEPEEPQAMKKAKASGKSNGKTAKVEPSKKKAKTRGRR